MMNIENTQLTKKERRALKRAEKLAKQETKQKNRKIRQITIWSFVVAVVIGGVFGITKLSPNSDSNSNLTTPLIDIVSDNDWIKGNTDSEIALIEYSDFQCPACGNYYPVIKDIMDNYGDKIKFIYRHFPLKQIHKNAESSAIATEAAGAQDKFWEMHDMLFENQKEWSNKINPDEIFLNYAKEIGLNEEKFKEDYKSKEAEKAVDEDLKKALSSGLNSTPSFFLNGEKIENPRSYEEFENMILELIPEEE